MSRVYQLFAEYLQANRGRGRGLGLVDSDHDVVFVRVD